MPGLVVDLETRKPKLGFGSGGVSGPGLRPVGVLATWKVRKAVPVPIIGLGGVGSAEDALQYILAGATCSFAVGTAALSNPRVPETIVHGLAEWCSRNGVANLSALSGTLDWK